MGVLFHKTIACLLIHQTPVITKKLQSDGKLKEQQDMLDIMGTAMTEQTQHSPALAADFDSSFLTAFLPSLAIKGECRGASSHVGASGSAIGNSISLPIEEA